MSLHSQVKKIDQTKKSWHHRIARLIRDAYNVKCNAPHCLESASHICEWDQMRSGRAVSAQKLYCGRHADSFAKRHQIDAANLPAVKLSQLEAASRDDWAYGEDI